MKVAQVIVDIANSEVDRVYDYLIPQNMNVFVGVRAVVPFGNRFIDGYVVSLSEHSDYDQDKLKPIKEIKTDYVISEELIELCHYMKNTFFLKLIDCIRLCLPTVIRQDKVGHLKVSFATLNKYESFVQEVQNNLPKNAKNQFAAIEYLKHKPVEKLSLLNAQFGATSVKKLVDLKVVQITSEVVNRSPLDVFSVGQNDKGVKAVELTEMQKQAINKINNSQKPVLLHGVTGSGKTEIYLNVIQKAVNDDGKTAIMLVPEISLTPQMVKRFKSRFGDKIAVLHSGLSSGEKHDEWVRIYSGEARIVVGARSAIFAPLNNLGIIIIDEEHDASYVSDSNPRYTTQDVAIFRSAKNNCPLVLGSATPSVENYYLTKTGEFELVELPTRVMNQAMPTVQIVDMLPEFRSGNRSPFSSVLLDELSAVVKDEKQAMLFINRRGFASSVMCRDCGHVPTCEHCDVPLSYHKHDHELKCHYCGKRYRMLTNCPTCKSESIKMGGVGTQRIVNELKQLFPGVKIFRMDNDTTTTKNAHNNILSEFENSKPAILVGTQMIAKGHDFPLVTLVGILDADLSLYFGQFRASEKTFQLITQVAGRAGRDKFPGKAVLQTYYPKHYVYNLVANYNYKGFYEKEINLREVTKFPPYTKVIRALITSEDDDAAKSATSDGFLLMKNLRLKNLNEFVFLEAMRSPVTKIKNKHRYQIVARIKNNNEIVASIFEICDKLKSKKVSVFVEINPHSLT